MRTVYKNPKELATCLKDLVDFYLDDLMTYEKLEDKITTLVNANKDRIYKDGKISSKIFNIVGSSRVDIITKVLADRQS